MKDLVENRVKIPPFKKLALALRLVRENGPLWTFLMGGYFVSSRVSPTLAERAFAASDSLRKRRALPGVNSAATNKFIWENWDWSDRGEEWTISPAWKESVIKTILEAHIHEGGLILEIGPGAGRWSIELQKRATKLLGIDISETSVIECRRRFASCANVEFKIGSGSDLDGVTDASVDAIWSFDVFVHINRSEFQCYAAEFARVLKPGGVGVIQHGSCGGSLGGWRSNLRTADVNDILRSCGLEIVAQSSSWQDEGREFFAGLYGDVITIFRNPSSMN
jgi:ubiquinone/menaquinone biosynthesis C-methylase UbiE